MKKIKTIFTGLAVLPLLAGCGGAKKVKLPDGASLTTYAEFEKALLEKLEKSDMSLEKAIRSFSGSVKESAKTKVTTKRGSDVLLEETATENAESKFQYDSSNHRILATSTSSESTTEKGKKETKRSSTKGQEKEYFAKYSKDGKEGIADYDLKEKTYRLYMENGEKTFEQNFDEYAKLLLGMSFALAPAFTAMDNDEEGESYKFYTKDDSFYIVYSYTEAINPDDVLGAYVSTIKEEATAVYTFGSDLFESGYSYKKTINFTYLKDAGSALAQDNVQTEEEKGVYFSAKLKDNVTVKEQSVSDFKDTTPTL